MEITRQVIIDDIDDFERQIADTKSKLAKLPAWADTFKDWQKIKKQRYDLENDISHYQKLIQMAQEGLNDD